MKLENQVTSLELSKKLSHLGVNQESLFYWDMYDQYDDGEPLYKISYDSNRNIDYDYAAFTGSELGEMLPARIEIGKKDGFFGSYKRNSDSPNMVWGCNYQNLDEKPICYTNADTEVDVRAKMLIYLLENNLITL